VRVLGGKMEHLTDKSRSSLARFRIPTGSDSAANGSHPRMGTHSVLMPPLLMTPPINTLVAGLDLPSLLASSSCPVLTTHGEPVKLSPS
jgi:hypothetical protein